LVAAPQDKRYFVLKGRELRWYGSKDDATLAYSAKTAVDLTNYAIEPAPEVPLVLALVPTSAAAKKGWYASPLLYFSAASLLHT